MSKTLNEINLDVQSIHSFYIGHGYFIEPTYHSSESIDRSRKSLCYLIHMNINGSSYMESVYRDNTLQGITHPNTGYFITINKLPFPDQL